MSTAITTVPRLNAWLPLVGALPPLEAGNRTQLATTTSLNQLVRPLLLMEAEDQESSAQTGADQHPTNSALKYYMGSQTQKLAWSLGPADLAIFI